MDVLPLAKRKQVLHALAPLAYAKVKSILCNKHIRFIECGNGILEGTETCDDGNTADGILYIYILYNSIKETDVPRAARRKVVLHVRILRVYAGVIYILLKINILSECGDKIIFAAKG